MAICLRILIVVATWSIASSAIAQGNQRPNWMLDTALYPYQRTVDNDVDLTFVINGKLPGRFSYFSFNNFKGTVTEGSARFDRSKQSIRFAVSEQLPIDLVLQGMLARGDGNDFYYAGVSWRVNDTPGLQEYFRKINLVWRVSVLPKRWGVDPSDANAWAVEHFFRLTVPQLSDRLYLSGFHDKTFDEDVPAFMPSRPVVSEVQLGARIWNDFYAVAEYRVNERRFENNYNLAVGIEYKARW